MHRLKPLGLALSLALAYPLAQALPQGAQVVQGQVQLSTPQPGHGLIQQGSDKAIINWQSFSIAANESLRIQQPGASSVLLNRVVGGDPSLILGQMQSNGRVFLVNPRGIVFGRGSQVDVGGLVASTLDLSDSAFLAGNYRFSAGPGAGGLQADGSITATDGTVALLAPKLDVGGSIQARRVGLVAAGSVTVDVEGDGLVLFNLRTDDDRDVALKFSGHMLANGGSVELRAQARAGAAGQVLNMDGVVQARGLRQQGGRIVIDGGTAGDTLVAGTLDAVGEQGGHVTVLGGRVGLLDAARLDASGRLGGGLIEVGGGFEGQGTAHNAASTWIAAGARLQADAVERGDGGLVSVWADQRTDVYGRISARGGRLGGNGGYVETSGKRQLNMPTGGVDVSAPLGRAGQWLLDPANLTIKSAADANVTTATPFQPSADGAVLDVATLNAALAAGTGVVVKTATGVGTAGEAGDILVEAAIVGSAGSLTLESVGGISFSGAGAINAGAGALNVLLKAEGGITTGAITTGGTATLDGKGAISLGATTSGALSVTTTAANTIGQTGALDIAGSASFTTGTGAITLNHASNRLRGTVNLSGGTAAVTNGGTQGLTLGSVATGNLTAITGGGNLNLGGGNVTGVLIASSNDGNITQASGAGGLTVTGAATLNAGIGSVALDGFSSAGLGITSTAGAISLGAVTVTGAGTLNATTAGSGAITQTGGSISVGGAATLGTANGAITLDDFNSAGLTATSTAGAIRLGFGTIAGVLNATASGSAGITQAAGGLIVTGNAGINAGTGAITLNDAANDWRGTVALTGGTTAITSTASGTTVLTLGALNTGNLTASTAGGALTLGHGTVGTLTANSVNGDIVQVGGTSLTAGGAVTLNAGSGGVTLSDLTSGTLGITSTAGVISLGDLSVTGTLTATTASTGAITQTGGSIGATGAATLGTDSGAITLGNFSSAGLTATSTGGAIRLGAGTIAGALNATTAGGAAITQAANGLIVTGSAGINAGTGAITLNDAANDWRGTVTLTGGATAITSTASGTTVLTLGAGTVGALTASTAGGDITQATGTTLTAHGLATLHAGSGNITLGSFNSDGLTATSTAGAIRLGTGTIAGALTATTAGSAGITQAAGGLVVTGNAGINADSGAITLSDAANDWRGTVALAGGTTAITSTGSSASVLMLDALNTGNLTASTLQGTLTLGHGNVDTLTATTGNGDIAQAGGTLTASGAATLHAGSGGITLGNFNSGALSATSTAGAIRLGAGTISGALDATTAGGAAITQFGSGLIVTGISTLNAGSGGDITLNLAGNSLRDTVNLTGATTQVSNSGAQALTLGTLSTGALTATTGTGLLTLGSGSVGTLTATTSNGHIAQSGGTLTASGMATLDAGSRNITLGNFNSAGLSATTTAGAIRLGAGTINGTLGATTAGGAAITQFGGGLVVTGNAGINAGSGAITLNDAANDWRGTVALTGGTTAIRSGASSTAVLNISSLDTGALTASTAGGTLTLGAGDVNGTLNANSGGGLLTQTGAGLHVTGAATLTSGTGNISLTAADNQWNGVTLSGNSLSLASNGALNILGLTQPANSALSLSSTGNLSLGAMTDIDTGSANLSLTTGGSFTAGGKLAGQNVSVTAQSGLTLGHDITAVDSLALTTSGGGINQTAGTIRVTATNGTATVNAGGGSAINLGGVANQFGGAVSLTGGATTLNASGALTLGALDTGDLDVTAGGAITQSAAAIVRGTATLDAGTADITLMAANDWRGAITATGGAVSLKSIDDLHLFALTQPANRALVLETVNVLTLPTGTGNINTGTEALTLSSQSGVFNTFGTLTGGNITLRGQSATLAHNIEATGTLVVETSAGAIHQTGGFIEADGASQFNAGSFGITLNRPLNDFKASVSLTGASVAITDKNALQLGASAMSGNLVAAAGGAISQELLTSLRVDGTAGFNAGTHAITLANAGNRLAGTVSLTGGATQLTDSGAVQLGASNVASLVLTTGGAVSQTAGLTTGALTVDAGSAAITLSHAGNQLGGTVALTGGATHVRTTGALTLGALDTDALTLQANGALNLGSGTVDGNLAANSGNGAVTQTSDLDVTGTTGIQAGTGSITLTRGGNSWGGALSLAGGATLVSSNGALTLGTLAVGALTLDTNGALDLGQGSVAGALTVNTHGAAVTQTGALSVTGATSLQAGAVTLMEAANQWGGAVQLTSGATQLTGTGALTLGTLATGNLGVTSSGALNLGRGVVTGDLTASSGGHAITQAGALQVTGAANVNAGTGNITLANTGNQLQGALSLTGNAVTLYNQPSLVMGTLSFNSLDATSAGSITLGSGTLSGALSARALGGPITQIAGGLTVAGDSTLQASSGITLTAAGNHFQGLVNLSGGTAALSNAGALRLGSLATSDLTVNASGALDLGSGSVGGALNATSSGAITQTGALSVSGAATLDAGGADITLEQSGNTFGGPLGLRGGTALLRNGGALNLGSLSLGALTVSSGGLQLGTGNIAGELKVDSSGVITQAAGGLAVGGATTLNAGSADITLADGGNALAGLISVQGGNVSLATSSALRLGAFTARQLTLNAGGDIELGAGSVAGDLSATTRGRRISQTGAMRVDGTAGFIADGSLVELVLGQAGNQLLGPIQMRGINGGSFVSADISSALDLSFSGDVQTLKLSSGGVLTLGGGNNTTLTAAAVRGIRQTGALRVSGVTTLTANGAALAVDLSHAGNDLGRVNLQAGTGSLGRVQLRDGDMARRDGLRVAGDAAQLELTSAGALDLIGGRYGSLAADTAATGAAITQSGALTVTDLATLKAGAGTITLTHADNQLPAIAVGSAGVATLSSAGDYTLRTSTVSTRLDLGGAGAIRLEGPLSGSGELVMNGSHSLTLQTAQGYTGGTRIRSGTLVLQGPDAQAGSGAVKLEAAGTLDLRDGARLGAELVIQGGTVMNSAGGGTLAGPVTLQSDLRVLTRAPLARAARAGLLAGGEGLTISGAIGDGGAGWGLRLDGGGTLSLAAANHYSGATQVNAGTLRADAAGALPATSAIQLAADARLVLGHDQTAGSLSGAGAVDLGAFTLATGADGSDTRFDGDISGTGGLTKTGSGRFTLGGNGAHDGATRVAGGELLLAGANALNERTAVSVDAGATLTVQQDIRLGSLAGAGTVDVQTAQLAVGANGGSTRFDGRLTGRGGLVKLGAGEFTLAGRHDLAGDVQVAAGRLQLDGAGVLPTTTGVGVAAGATLALLSDQPLGALDGAGHVALGAHTLTLGTSGRSSRFDGVISGSGGLVKQGSGTLGLGAANVYTGSTHVSGGTLSLHVAQALHGASTLAVDAGASVQVNADQAVASLSGAGALALNARLALGAGGADSRFDGVASGSGSLVKQGLGTLTLTAAQRNSGATVIEAGSVALTAAGSLGEGEIRNQGQLRLERDDPLQLDQAITGSGSLVVARGQVTLANAANAYTGATDVQGGSLITTGAERLPDASAVRVAAGAQLQLGGAETIAALQAAGSVRLAGNLTTQGEQVYTGSLTLTNPAGLTLSGSRIDASASSNQFGIGPLGLRGGQALVTAKDGLVLGDVTLSGGGRIEAPRLQLDGALKLSGGNLTLVATAAPDDAKATPQGTAQVPVAGLAMATAEATVQQGASGAITVDEGARLAVHASGGGSVLLGQDANDFKGQLSVLSGAGYNTAWTPNAKGQYAVQSLVRVAGKQVLVGDAGIEADVVSIRAERLGTVDEAQLVARLPFDEIVLGRALSLPAMTLELAPGAFTGSGSFGAINGRPLRVVVGSTATGARTSGPNAGYLTVLPKDGAQGAVAVVLSGPVIGSQPASGGPGYRFFHDGASQATEVPVIYNGVLPLTPAASGALSSINGDAEDARRARFQETVRTENVTVRLRSGVIAEVGPGRASTQGSEGAAPPVQCDPAAQPVLSCK
ncbi:filamentous hemagglutinin N-terminal domain-containing protein [Roseateles asaccharophilus]|uniref:Filamentous hemagglutinin family protein n=1 Tax=Roseateles asaccharophilus TaxID=582607 RepID=A0ABU2A9H5_9BURK|nr:filamentous hemagglutinin N-terminal domain-containing protein [Roseateles asaccharophilus]MDR7333856.1 filamentous hemagglutinin family protein [Roseateles asaccharophilus]